MFLTSYRKFRERLLKNESWELVARLGFAAFDVMDWWAFNTSLVTISHGQAGQAAEISMSGLDVSNPRVASEKARQLKNSQLDDIFQDKLIDGPDARIVFDAEVDLPLLNQCADGLVGLQTSDDAMFVMSFWEVYLRDGDIWELMQATPDLFTEYAGLSRMVRWEKGEGLLLSLPTAYPTKGLKALGKPGVAMHRMGRLFPYHYSKERFHQNVATIIPKNDANLPAIWCFCSSPEYTEAVRRIDQKLNVTNATLVKVPFDLDHWTKIADEKYPNGLPLPYSDDPTQWIFHGHPCGSVIWDEEQKWTTHGPLRTDHTVLQITVARLLGYRWPAELDPDMELAEEQHQWVERCNDLLPFADDDGIVCIPPVRGEASAADRLLNLLAAAYDDTWSNDVLAELLKNTDHAGKTLETWLRDKFFIQHCKLFHHRPFIWHIWDGLREGFAALVNYHKLDYKNLETLIYTYLGDWIKQQKDDIDRGFDGAQERLAAAEQLKKRLELILKGEAPHDIFVRWKPIEEQPIGWNPDLNDGVRLNIRPFMTVPDVKKKGAGVLRDKPNIKWKKDRGKDVTTAPWYNLGAIYGGKEGDRINDHHLSLAEKKTIS